MAREFYTTFKDRISSTIQQRGALHPKWEDVLLVAADTAETRKVFGEQGINADGLQRDVLFSLRFGRPELAIKAAGNLPYRDLFSKASADLLNDITIFSEQKDFLSDPANHAATRQVIGFLSEYLDDRERIVNDPDGIQIADIKARMLHSSITAFVQQYTPSLDSLPDVPDHMKPVVMETNRQFAADIMQQFGNYTLDKSRQIATPDQPILMLDTRDELEVANGGEITPFQVVDTTEKAVDPFLKYLLHRNGLIAPEDYDPEHKMPSPVVIREGLSAFSYAESLREKSVKPSHLLPSLLHNPAVMQLIRELDEEGKLGEKEEPDSFLSMFGISKGRDLIKFYTAVQAELSSPKTGERFRYQVKASDEIKAFLTQADQIVSQEEDIFFTQARIVGALFETDQQAKDILLKSGLTEEQLNKWSDTIATLQQKRDEERKVNPDTEATEKEEVFKVSDRQLKQLLDQYSVDLTKMALEGKIDPVIGRNEELYQMMRILLQRGRSNPLLLGEPGVGKTTLFDGLAQHIASGSVPKSLIGAQVIRLDLSEMNSGAMFRGQFEARLLPIIQGVAERNKKGDQPPIILCIDELHAALMAGTASGTPGANELLKPYLTKGELSIVGATTQRDYAKYIAVDSGLERRFQTIFVEEPKDEETVQIVTGLKEHYTSHHKLEVDDYLLQLAVELSSRYLPTLQQPDKSIRVLDAALARARMAEKDTMDKSDLIATIAAEAKIDPQFLSEGDEERFLALKDTLPAQVLGQDHATLQIAEALITAKADLHDPKKPLGVFVLLGPTGVGKTETARALSRLLHGSDKNLIRIDMSDYMERHHTSKLFGASPEYVGYGEEGVLTGAVRRQPYSVVVLDEIEKAHPEVLKQFLQIFEEGEKVDGQGKKVSFRNTVILMTSNLGAQSAVAEAEAEGIDPQKQRDEWIATTEPIYSGATKSHFSPEFLNRVDSVVTYQPLDAEVMGQLVETEVTEISKRIQQRYGVVLTLTSTVKDTLAKEGYDPEYGARGMKRVIKSQLTQPLAQWVLQNRSRFNKGEAVEVSGLKSDFKAMSKPKTEETS